MESQINKDLIVIRSYRPEDRNFILATWLRGIYYGDNWLNQIPKDIFMANYHIILERLLQNPDLVIRVACLKDDADVILGYAASRRVVLGEADMNVLDFVFVKSAWRKIGIAKMLIPQRLNAVTHLTKTGLSIMKQKLPDVVFNPWLI